MLFIDNCLECDIEKYGGRRCSFVFHSLIGIALDLKSQRIAMSSHTNFELLLRNVLFSIKLEEFLLWKPVDIGLAEMAFWMLNSMSHPIDVQWNFRNSKISNGVSPIVVIVAIAIVAQYISGGLPKAIKLTEFHHFLLLKLHYVTDQLHNSMSDESVYDVVSLLNVYSANTHLFVRMAWYWWASGALHTTRSTY